MLSKKESNELDRFEDILLKSTLAILVDMEWNIGDATGETGVRRLFKGKVNKPSSRLLRIRGVELL